MPVCIGVLKETSAHEARVALTPDVAAKFAELGATVALQRGAGESSHFGDDAYKQAKLATSVAELLAATNVLLTVQPPTLEKIDALAPGTIVVGFMQAHRELDMVRRLRDKRITSFAVEFIPR